MPTDSRRESGSFAAALQISMRHGIGDDIDAQRIRYSVGILFEVLDVLAFAFPAVGDVVVVAKERHQTIVVIEVAPEMRRCIAIGERTVPVFVIQASLPGANTGQLAVRS